jgi:drug/metabolite transporter (DMT)-like permease
VDKNMWLVYSVLAGLCWGTYVPFVQQGIQGLGRNSLASFLCVGVAYFLIAVLFPIGMFFAGEKTPTWNAYGITFATLAGVAGALGALCVIFANRSAGQLARENPALDVDYRLFIGPIIFAMAPLLNTLVSLLWHPSPAEGAMMFGLKHLPSWKFFLGIVLTGAGTFLVLYSKEEAEKNPSPATPQPHAALAPAVPQTPPMNMN